jgi:hypothetical protein
LENAALAAAVNSCQEVDVLVGTPVEHLVTHEVLQMDVLDDPGGLVSLSLSLLGNLTEENNTVQL